MPQPISVAVATIPRRRAALVEGPHYLLDFRVRSSDRFEDLDPFGDWMRARERPPLASDEVRELLRTQRPMYMDSDPPGVTKRMRRTPTVLGEHAARHLWLDWSAPIWRTQRAALLGRDGRGSAVWRQFVRDAAVPRPELLTTVERRRYRLGDEHWLDVVLLDVGAAIEFGASIGEDAQPLWAWSGAPTPDARLLELDLDSGQSDDRSVEGFFETFGAPPEVLTRVPDLWSAVRDPWLPLSALVQRQESLQAAAAQRRLLDPDWEPLLVGETSVERGYGELGMGADGRPVLHVTLWDAIAIRYAEALVDGRVRECQAFVPRSTTERHGKVFIAPRKDEQVYCSETCRSRMFQRDHYEAIQARRTARE